MVITSTVDYVRWTQTTAVYLEKVVDKGDNKLEYELFGALDEVGEIAGLLKRQIRDDQPFNRNCIEKELGDLAWYLARIHYEHADLDLTPENSLYQLLTELDLLEQAKGMTCFDLAIMACEKMKRHFMSESAAAKYMFGNKPKNLQQMLEQMHHGFTRNDASSQFVVGMWRRINPEHSVTGLLMHLASELNSAEAVIDWCALCYKFNFEILDVLQANVIKLESRKERGTIHGKGSER